MASANVPSPLAWPRCLVMQRMRLAALQARLHSGTSCGSCLPQLRASAQALAGRAEPSVLVP